MVVTGDDGYGILIILASQLLVRGGNIMNKKSLTVFSISFYIGQKFLITRVT